MGAERAVPKASKYLRGFSLDSAISVWLPSAYSTGHSRHLFLDPCGTTGTRNGMPNGHILRRTEPSVFGLRLPFDDRPPSETKNSLSTLFITQEQHVPQHGHTGFLVSHLQVIHEPWRDRVGD